MPTEAIFAIQNMVTSLIVGATLVGIAFSPLMRAFGSRVMHGKTSRPGTPAEAARVEYLSDEVATLTRQLDELQERLDFTERVLAQAKERGLLPASEERRG